MAPYYLIPLFKEIVNETLKIFIAKQGISCHVTTMDPNNKKITSLHVCKQYFLYIIHSICMVNNANYQTPLKSLNVVRVRQRTL